MSAGVIDLSDYEEKSIKELLEDSMFIQLIIMFWQVVLLLCRFLCDLARDIVGAVFLALRRVLGVGEDFDLMLDYLLPFLYYMKLD